MNKNEEIKLILRGIQRLRWELNQVSIDGNFQEWWDKYSRMNNLLECLNQTCWAIYGDRANDKEFKYEADSVSYEEKREVTASLKTYIR